MEKVKPAEEKVDSAGSRVTKTIETVKSVDQDAALPTSNEADEESKSPVHRCFEVIQLGDLEAEAEKMKQEDKASEEKKEEEEVKIDVAPEAEAPKSPQTAK